MTFNETLRAARSLADDHGFGHNDLIFEASVQNEANHDHNTIRFRLYLVKGYGRDEKLENSIEVRANSPERLLKLFSAYLDAAVTSDESVSVESLGELCS